VEKPIGLNALVQAVAMPALKERAPRETRRHTVATDDSKVKSATGHVEPGTEKAARDGRGRS